RLVSAALWKVLKQRDVMQYGVVEEFVTSACQTVPKLLTVRHQGKLALGLRARLILELCRTQPDVQIISQHLERIRPPEKNDVKILKSVENFHSFVHTILKDSDRALKRFLCFLSKEQFPVEYGPNFDKELEKLLWEFLIRLDQLLPVPNLTQTVSWLSNAPPVLEECAQAATQPQLLKILLEHQSCLGHLESAASLPPNMGDSILTSLSLPPSGRTASNPSTESSKSPSNPSRQQPADTTPFITPVIGLISNEEVPAMISARKKSMQADEGSGPKDAANKQRGPKESPKFTLLKEKLKPNDDQGQEEDGRSPLNKNTKRKRKQADKTESDSDDDEVFNVSRSAKKRESTYMHRERDQGADEDKEKGEERDTGCSREVLIARMSELGIRGLHQPGDPSIQSAFASCLSKQPIVHIRKLPSSVLTRFLKRDSYCHDFKCICFNCLCLPQLFTKRYYKTKHGTFVPTLREFWKPGATRRNLSSGNRRR
uniref:TERF1 (TRF1)-interacting nuclear factor 2 n=1 Tax=Oryzias latipes TaxID=8090 RepID=H2LT82_ORYLA